MQHKPVNMQRQHDLYQISKFYRHSALLSEKIVGKPPFPNEPAGYKPRLPMVCPPAYTSYHKLIRYFGRACEDPRCHDVRCYPLPRGNLPSEGLRKPGPLLPQLRWGGERGWPRDLH